MRPFALLLSLAAATSAAAQDTTCPGTAITLSATTTPERPAPGEHWAITLRAENTSAHDSGNVSIKGDIPFNTTFVGIQAPIEWSCRRPTRDSDVTITCTATTLHSRASSKIRLLFAIGPRTPPDTELTATFTAATDANGMCTATAKTQLQPYEEPLIAWTRKNMSVRRTFDGSKDENKPANVTWIGRDAANGKAFWDINAAIKLVEIPFGPKARPEAFILYPAIEWHRQTTIVTPVNKGSGKLALEWFPLPSTGHTVVPFATANVQYTRDWEKQTWSTSAAVLGSLWSKKPWLPGAITRLADLTQAVRYYVYLGAEYYDKVPVVAGEPLYTGLARFSGEWNWLSWHDPTYRITQVLLEYTYRRRLSGDDGINHRLGLTAIEANLYLDRKSNVAIGYRYQRGDDPVKDFAYDEQSSVGLKFKF